MWTCYEVSFQSYHDNQGHVCWPQSFKSFWCISGPPVVEGSTGNIKPAWRVNGQLPIDIVLVPFTLQHWDTKRERDGIWAHFGFYALNGKHKTDKKHTVCKAMLAIYS